MGLPHLAGLAKKLAKVQDGRCAICHREFADLMPGISATHARKTLEHVYPRSKYPALKHKGNVVATHYVCNATRGNAEPTPALLAKLEAVNERMGWEVSLDQFKTEPASVVPLGAVLLLDQPCLFQRQLEAA